MTLDEAIELIKSGIPDIGGVWADIGAGTGMFTKALARVLGGENRSNRGNGGNGGSLPQLQFRRRIYAVDKNPHALWKLQSTSEVEIVVVEGDFNNNLELPPLDGIVMANALHYAEDHQKVFINIVRLLKAGGRLILVEYDTDTPNAPWVPYPVSFKTFQSLCRQTRLSEPKLIGTTHSQYGYEQIYAAVVAV